MILDDSLPMFAGIRALAHAQPRRKSSVGRCDCGRPGAVERRGRHWRRLDSCGHCNGKCGWPPDEGPQGAPAVAVAAYLEAA
jgi:hypothetical protein